MLNSRLHLMPDSPPPISDSARGTPEYFRLLFDEAPAACIVTNSACIVTDANRAAETMLLRPRSGMLDKPFKNMIALSDRPSFDKIAADMLLFVFDTSRPLCIKPRTGADVDVFFKAKMVRSVDGAPEFISWVFLESLSSEPRDIL